MYRWFGSRLSPRSEVTPVAVPPPLPPVHCQRCSRTFWDHRAYHEHMQTSDLHHHCRRCGNDHESHRALQVVSETPFYLLVTFQIHGTRVELTNLYRMTAPLSTDRGLSVRHSYFNLVRNLHSLLHLLVVLRIGIQHHHHEQFDQNGGECSINFERKQRHCRWSYQDGDNGHPRFLLVLL